MDFSVLISTYHKENPIFLEECFDSILSQTLLPSEIILVKDGLLTPELEETIEKYICKLPLKVIGQETNQGLAKALNIGLKKCSHELVIRMDTDDICSPKRFRTQVNFMLNNPDISVCSSWVEERIYGMNISGFVKKIPQYHAQIAKTAKWKNPINHPATILRKSHVLKVGGYPFIYPEDYALWSLMLVKGYRFYNIQEVLLYMRTDENFYNRRGLKLLMGELILLNYQMKIDFINRTRFLVNAIIRVFLRSLPNRIKVYVYHNLR